MEPVADWDREMTPSEVGRLPREITVLRATTFVRRKVELLEEMGTNFPLFLRHFDKQFPWKPASFRRWRIPDLGIRSWGAPSVEQHPDRQDLMRRYRNAIVALRPMRTVAERFKQADHAGEATVIAAVVEERVTRDYEALIQAQKLEIANLRLQVMQMAQALRLANKKAGEAPPVSI
jgi:hypothetical protein